MSLLILCDFCNREFFSQNGDIICPSCIADLDDEDVWEETPLEGI